MSSQGARGSPERAPRELLRSFLGSEMELGDAQKSSPEAFESSEGNLKIIILDFHETIEQSTKLIDFSSSEGKLGTQIYFQEACKLREQQLEGEKHHAEREEKQQEATKTAPRSSRRARKSRFLVPVDRL